MSIFIPAAATYTSYEEPDRIMENVPWLEIRFGKNMVYLEFEGGTGNGFLKMAKLRLPAVSVPYHSRIDIWALKGISVRAGMSWNESPVYEGEYIDTVDFYRERTGWYEVDVSRAFEGVKGRFHITFKLAAQTYPGREVIRLGAGSGGTDRAGSGGTAGAAGDCGNNGPQLILIGETSGEGRAEDIRLKGVQAETMRFEGVQENGFRHEKAQTEDIRIGNENGGQEIKPEEDGPEEDGSEENGPEENGYEMWLRYRPKAPAYCRENLRCFGRIHIESRFERAIRYELSEALGKMAGIEPQWCGNGQYGTAITEDAGMEEGSYRITEKSGVIRLTGGGVGVLYGLYALLSHIQRGKSLHSLCIEGNPWFKRRIFSHWDNFDGSIERGYAGGSFWNWRNPDQAAFRRYRDYGRLCASVGVNGLVVNNVNPDPAFISDENLPKLAALADCFRDYGIRVYVSVSFDTPILQGGLETADPVDDEVKDFWQRKIDGIYRLIPDFGGFCVKGDSEGQPGPLKYGRDHACGANMLAERLKPYGGIVLWRAFVYHVPGLGSDRACQAYQVFKPLDGKFQDNVVLQIKNGPLDFQVNEPLSPLFGSMEGTKLGLEVQTALEYKGQASHLFFVPDEIRQVLLEETGNGAVAAVCREVFNSVANTGNDRNWTRCTMSQANFFATGRLAFDPFLSLEEVEKEWAELTFSADRETAEVIAGLLAESCSAYASYAAPYGLGFLCDRDTHFHPEPESRGAFHGCNGDGLGYDRTAGGSGFCLQYREAQRRRRENAGEVEEEQLLWYHHLPFQYRMRDGRTLIQSVYDSLFDGAEKTLQMAERFQSLDGKIDKRRYGAIYENLLRQREEALVWRNNGLAYFFGISGIPDESGRRLKAEPVRITIRTKGNDLLVRTELREGRLYLVDTGLAVKDRYLTERILSMAVCGGHGLCIKMDGRDESYHCKKPEMPADFQAFFVTEDGFLVRGDVEQPAIPSTKYPG